MIRASFAGAIAVTCAACTAQHPAPQGRAAEVEPTPAPAVAGTGAARGGRWVDLDVADDLVAARGCAVERGGALWCWGGRAGDVTRPGGAAPARVVGVEHARAVAVGGEQVCRVDADGRVRCFDGMGPFWREVAGIERAIDVAVASDRGCALAEGGALACWQDGGPASPVADGVADFALGGHGGCVLFAAGGLACWSHAVQRAARRGGVRRLDAVGVRDLAIADDRWLWIVDAEGKVRRGDPFPEGPDWVEYGAVAGAVEIAAAFDHVCVRTGEGAALCPIAERGAALACGVAPELRASVPGIRGVLAFASAERSVCAIDLRGRVVCALLPDLYEEDSTVVPATVPGVAGAVGIAASGREFCAVAGDGRVRCWGVQAGPRELDGGHLRLEVRLGPVAATDLRGVAAIFGNDLGFGSVDREGRVRRWRLDDGAAIDEATPTFDAAVVEVVAGDEHFCARDVAGAVTCWGVERQGQFGRVPRAVSLVPTPLRFGGPAG